MFAQQFEGINILAATTQLNDFVDRSTAALRRQRYWRREKYKIITKIITKTIHLIISFIAEDQAGTIT